jgi:hypothetical protein
VPQDRPALQALREWLARAAVPVRQDRLAQLDPEALQVLLARRGLPDFPALLAQQGLLDHKEPKAPPALRALRELLGPKGRRGRKAPKEWRVRLGRRAGLVRPWCR